MKKKFIITGAAVICLSFSSLLIAATKDKISMEEAKAIALSKVQGGVVTGIELEQKLGKAVYEVEVYLNGYEYDIKLDAATGAGISVKKEIVHEKDAVSTKLGSLDTAVITESEAVEIALWEVPGAEVAEIELDHKKDETVYELELVKDYTEYDVKIDAVTGSILKCKIDD